MTPQQKSYIYKPSLDELIGKRLRFYRHKQQMSQKSLAALVGVSSQLIHKYEIGETKMTVVRLHECAKALNIPTHYFLLNEKDKAEDILTKNVQARVIANAFHTIQNPEVKSKLGELIIALARESKGTQPKRV